MEQSRARPSVCCRLPRKFLSRTTRPKTASAFDARSSSVNRTSGRLNFAPRNFYLMKILSRIGTCEVNTATCDVFLPDGFSFSFLSKVELTYRSTIHTREFLQSVEFRERALKQCQRTSPWTRDGATVTARVCSPSPRLRRQTFPRR